MSDSILNIVINTVKRGGGDKETVTGLKKLSAGFKELTGMSLGSATAMGIAGMATSKLINLVKSSIAETEQYVTTIADQARVIGIDVEEMSRLVQAADDVFISQEKLEKAMLAATRKGIDVSRDGLKQLSAEYLSLDPTMERGKFLMDKFGRSGADMGKFMELGADGIDSAMDSISKSLLVTAASRANIENYKRSVDNLKDSWQGFKYQLGNENIPQLDWLMRILTKGVDPVEAQYRAIAKLKTQINWLGMAAGGTSESAAAKIEILEQQIVDLQTGVVSADGTIKTFAGDVGMVTQYFKELTAEMIFNKLAAGMDEEAQMQLAMQMGLVNWETYSTITALDDLTEKYDTNADGVITATEKTAAYNTELAALIGYQNSLKDVDVNYTVHFIQKGSLNNADIVPGDPPIGGANGLNFIVPPGYPNDSFPIRVQSGEHVQVTPAGETQQMLGGVTNINNTFVFNGVPLSELMRQLKLQGVGR